MFFEWFTAAIILLIFCKSNSFADVQMNKQKINVRNNLLITQNKARGFANIHSRIKKFFSIIKIIREDKTSVLKCIIQKVNNL